MEDIIGPQKNHYKYLIGKNKNVLLDIKPNRFFLSRGGGAPHFTACGILVCQSGVEPMPLAVEAES